MRALRARALPGLDTVDRVPALHGGDVRGTRIRGIWILRKLRGRNDGRGQRLGTRGTIETNITAKKEDEDSDQAEGKGVDARMKNEA